MKAAQLKIMILKISIISPIVASLFLQIYNARISVPSSTPPPLTEKPTPAPRNNPPKIAISSLSWVITGKLTVARTSDSPAIAMKVLIANGLEIWLNASIMNGTFIMNIQTDRGSSDEKEMRREIQVTPPSIK
jgi:hypothetical protein